MAVLEGGEETELLADEHQWEAERRAEVGGELAEYLLDAGRVDRARPCRGHGTVLLEIDRTGGERAARAVNPPSIRREDRAAAPHVSPQTKRRLGRAAGPARARAGR
jgi:hypothetical protein